MTLLPDRAEEPERATATDPPREAGRDARTGTRPGDDPETINPETINPKTINSETIIYRLTPAPRKRSVVLEMATRFESHVGKVIDRLA